MKHLVWDALVLLMQFTTWLQAMFLEIRQYPWIFGISVLLVEIKFVTDHHQAGGFSFNDHVASLLALVLKNTHNSWHITQILEAILRGIPTQLLNRVIPRCHCYGVSTVGMGAGDVTWGIANDKRLLRGNHVPQEGVHPLLGNWHQDITIMVVAAIGTQPKIMPDPKRLELELRAHGEIARQEPEDKVRLLRQGFKYMRNPGHEAAGAMRFLEGQTEAGDIVLV